RAAPRDDLVSRIAAAADEEGGWSHSEVQGFIAGLVFAGHETTKNQLGTMVGGLAEKPQLWATLSDGTLGVGPGVQEGLRSRYAATAVRHKVEQAVARDWRRREPRTRVCLSLGGADHEETVIPRAEELAPVENAVAPHIAFGHGPHNCIGAALARA